MHGMLNYLDTCPMTINMRNAHSPNNASAAHVKQLSAVIVALVPADISMSQAAQDHSVNHP
jgi:hypothetical protein